MIPFMTEQIYQNIVRNIDKNAPESIHLCDYPEVKEEWIDLALESDMDEVLDTVVMGRAARNTANIKNRQPIAQMYVKADHELSEFYVKIIEEELNVKKVTFTEDVRAFTSYTFKPQLKTVGPKYGKLLGRIRQALTELDGSAAMDTLNESGALTFDFDGQEALKDSRVLIVGLGGLGCAASQYLASAGVGNLTLLDFDTVSLSNLQRQTLHSDATVGQPKVESARDALTRINPHIAITPVNALLDDAELAAMIAKHDLVLDCTDNVAVRNQLNAGCFAAKVPLVSGAAIRMEGQITVFTYQDGEPCYRCLSRLFGENALTCVEAGVMAPLIGVIGSLQAMEAIKLLAGYGKPASGKIVMYDAMTCQFREMKLMRNPGCEVCGQ